MIRDRESLLPSKTVQLRETRRPTDREGHPVSIDHSNGIHLTPSRRMRGILAPKAEHVKER
jgi:hypothetical protein